MPLFRRNAASREARAIEALWRRLEAADKEMIEHERKLSEINGEKPTEEWQAEEQRSRKEEAERSLRESQRESLKLRLQLYARKMPLGLATREHLAKLVGGLKNTTVPPTLPSVEDEKVKVSGTLGLLDPTFLDAQMERNGNIVFKVSGHEFQLTEEGRGLALTPPKHNGEEVAHPPSNVEGARLRLAKHFRIPPYDKSALQRLGGRLRARLRPS